MVVRLVAGQETSENEQGYCEGIVEQERQDRGLI